MREYRYRVAGLIMLACCLLAVPGLYSGPARAQATSRFFPQTGHTVKGKFLQYWDNNGGLAQQGYPISEEMQETSELDHKTYTVQYFERALFELHPENAGTPYEVLLAQLGTFEYRQRYLAQPEYVPPPLPPGQPTPTPEPWQQQRPSTDRPRLFPETGHTLGGPFRTYWESHGGLAQQGYPITDEFRESSRLDGKVYTVQYFERAVFELHPEFSGTQNEVLLAQLGTFRYQGRYSTNNLTLPGPSMPGRAQLHPQGSDTFLIWGEETPPDPKVYTPPNADIFGMDLSSGRVLTVTAAAGEQTNAALSGSLVVWESGDPTYQTQNTEIHSRDLLGGPEFTVAAGPMRERLPALFGRSVAWVAGINPQGQAEHLMLKDLGSGTTTVVETLPPDRFIMAAPALNDRYLAWVETTWTSRDGLPFRVQVLDRRTGQITTVKQTGLVHDETVPLAIQLLDPVLLAGRATSFGTTIPLDGSTTLLLGYVAHSDTTLVWSEDVDMTDRGDIWGQRLTDDRPVRLVAQPGSQGGPTIAGAWLVWVSANGQDASRLESLPLAAAFAGAANPPFPFTPTPVPTPLPVSANLNAISYFAIDEGFAVGDGGAMLFWDGGDRWQPQEPATSHDLRAVDILPTDIGPPQGWAVGDGVVMQVSLGGGEPINVEGRLNSVRILAQDDAWAAGVDAGAPLVMHYSGDSWQRVPLAFAGYGLNSLDMLSPTEGWAVGDGPALHYSGGAWSEVPLPTQSHLNGLAMVSHDEGWAVGDGGVILHYSGGQWEAAASPTHATLRAVAMRDSGEGFAVGDAGTILHYAGGAWSIMPSPVAVNLRGLQRRLAVGVGAVGEGGVVLGYRGPNGWVQEQARSYGPSVGP